MYSLRNIIIFAVKHANKTVLVGPTKSVLLLRFAFVVHLLLTPSPHVQRVALLILITTS